MSVVSMRISVDLPAPFGPSRPKISPVVDGERDRVDRGEVAERLVIWRTSIALIAWTRAAHGATTAEWQQHVGGHADGEPAVVLSTRRRISNVLMSRLVRLDVALRGEPGVHAAIEHDAAARPSPDGRRTVSVSPSRTRSMYVSSTSARTHRSSGLMSVTIGWPGVDDLACRARPARRRCRRSARESRCRRAGRRLWSAAPSAACALLLIGAQLAALDRHLLGRGAGPAPSAARCATDLLVGGIDARLARPYSTSVVDPGPAATTAPFRARLA